MSTDRVRQELATVSEATSSSEASHAASYQHSATDGCGEPAPVPSTAASHSNPTVPHQNAISGMPPAPLSSQAAVSATSAPASIAHPTSPAPAPVPENGPPLEIRVDSGDPSRQNSASDATKPAQPQPAAALPPASLSASSQSSSPTTPSAADNPSLDPLTQATGADTASGPPATAHTDARPLASVQQQHPVTTTAAPPCRDPRGTDPGPALTRISQAPLLGRHSQPPHSGPPSLARCSHYSAGAAPALARCSHYSAGGPPALARCSHTALSGPPALARCSIRPVQAIPTGTVRATQVICFNAILMVVAEVLIEVLILAGAFPKLPFRLDFFFLTLLSGLLAVHTVLGFRADHYDTSINALQVSGLVEAALIAGDIMFIANEGEKYSAALPTRVPFAILTGVNLCLVVYLFVTLLRFHRNERRADSGHS